MTNIGQAARSRSRKIREELAKRGQIEHHTETRVDLAEGDRERIDQLEREIGDLKECLFQTLETVKGVCPQILEMMAMAMQIDARQAHLEVSQDTLAESIKKLGRGVVRRDVA